MSDATGPMTRAVLAVALGVFAFGAALSCLGAGIGMGVPWLMSEQQASHRDEVPAEVDALRRLELARDAGFGAYVPCGSRGEAARALTAEPRPAADDPAAACFTSMLSWKPEGERRGAYWIEVDATTQDFTVFGIIDGDGDGEYAEYRATSREPARVVTPPRVY